MSNENCVTVTVRAYDKNGSVVRSKSHRWDHPPISAGDFHIRVSALAWDVADMILNSSTFHKPWEQEPEPHPCCCKYACHKE